jgi:hypothetical protein
VKTSQKDYESKSGVELRAILKKREVIFSGTKPEMIERLHQIDEESLPKQSKKKAEIKKFEALSIIQLREKARENKVSPSGSREELVERLTGSIVSDRPSPGKVTDLFPEEGSETEKTEEITREKSSSKNSRKKIPTKKSLSPKEKSSRKSKEKLPSPVLEAVQYRKEVMEEALKGNTRRERRLIPVQLELSPDKADLVVQTKKKNKSSSGNYGKMKKPELIELAQSHGLKYSDNKGDIIKRLERFDKGKSRDKDFTKKKSKSGNKNSEESGSETSAISEGSAEEVSEDSAEEEEATEVSEEEESSSAEEESSKNKKKTKKSKSKK